MKRLRIIFVFLAVAAFSLLFSGVAAAKGKVGQAQLDSIAATLATRIENGAWTFVPTRFTGSNNVCVEFLDANNNRVSSMEDVLMINLDFIGARIVPMASTPHQKMRAMVNAAEVRQLNSVLPNNVRVQGKVTGREVKIGKNSKSVTLVLKYDIGDSNLNQMHNHAEVSLRINTASLVSTLVFYNMDIEGTMEGKVTLL